MQNMYRVMAFWTAIFSIMFFLGEMKQTALLFVGITGFFLAVGFLKLSERTYLYIFGAFLTIFFVGFTYYSTFQMVPGMGGH
ncbi:DUF2626 family protein [Bacillus tianshenii]|nr:DUF2626 family protein [Bacillus tianshenii]